MPVVPLFHANGWALAFAAPMVGAQMIMPGMKLDGASVYELLNTYKVTCTAAVPTVWLGLLQYLEATGGKLPYLKRVVIGGSACPRTVTEKFQDIYGVDVIHAWGMTEIGRSARCAPSSRNTAGSPGPRASTSNRSKGTRRSVSK
jgi:fatty-acyl-CoA synthase